MRPAVLNPLFADVTALQGVGPRLAALVSRAAGPRVVDVLLTLPLSLIDRSARPKVADAPYGAIATVEVTVDRHDPPRVKRLPYKIICSDETGFLTLVFFHAKPDYLVRMLPEGQKRIVSGRIEEYEGSRQMTHPDHIVDPKDVNALPLIEPVYPLTTGLTPGVMRKAAALAVRRAPQLAEWQDAAWLKKQRWPSWLAAIQSAHAPKSAADLAPTSPARMRLAYDELLANQLALLLIRRARLKSAGRALAGDGRTRARIREALPF
ncbi:MAG: ATP-dependent DNA helicase RecG, partial [Parvularculaceae bacterium]